MKQLILCLWAILCLGCVDAGDVVLASTASEPILMLHKLEGVAPVQSVVVHEQEPVADPYKEHDTWCEDLYKMNCECPARDPIICKEPKEPCPLDRTGHVQICRRPGWARREGSNAYQCEPKWLSRSEQRQRRQSQRVIVDAVCERPQWADELSEWGQTNRMGSDPSKLCWHLPGKSEALKQCKGQHFCQPEKLTKLLALVALRESTWMNDTIHEMAMDIEANRNSYAKATKRGWYADNPHFANFERWSRGYGWYGQNAALHVFHWDSLAPPEILCRQVESTEVYLRKARGAFRKLWSMYGNAGYRVYKLDTGEEVTVKGVTWYDIHRAASSGKLVPEKVITTRRWHKKKEKWLRVGFVSRARSKRVQLDPFETVMWEMLGAEISKATQNEIADEIRQQIRQRTSAQTARNQVVVGRTEGEATVEG